MRWNTRMTNLGERMRPRRQCQCWWERRPRHNDFSFYSRLRFTTDTSSKPVKHQPSNVCEVMYVCKVCVVQTLHSNVLNGAALQQQASPLLLWWGKLSPFYQMTFTWYSMILKLIQMLMNPSMSIFYAVNQCIELKTFLNDTNNWYYTWSDKIFVYLLLNLFFDMNIVCNYVYDLKIGSL